LPHYFVVDIFIELYQPALYNGEGFQGRFTNTDVLF